jgi:hypothetical protein
VNCYRGNNKQRRNRTDDKVPQREEEEDVMP